MALLPGIAAPILFESALAQAPTGFLDRSVRVEGTEYPFQVYVPRTFDEGVSLPVILSLHGGGARGSDGLRQTVGGLADAIRRDAARWPALAVFPQSPVDGPGWQDLGGRIAIAALDQAIVEFNADRSRVYLIGASQGGNGAWYLACQHPERFAAAVVVAGFIMARRGTTSGAWYPALVPDDSEDPFAVIAARVAEIPVWIFHGDADSIVPVEQSRGMAAALESAGASVRYTEYPGVGHGSMQPALAEEELPAWLFAKARR
jgi:predicted peptidase